MRTSSVRGARWAATGGRPAVLRKRPLGAILAALALLSSFLTWQLASAPSALADQTFAFVGSPQMYVVPDGVTSINVTLNGAQGTSPTGGGTGGLGGRVTATISVTPGEVLQLMVGGQGSYNGGGTVAAAGGGATDIRRPAFSTESSCAYNLNCALNKRIIVAGGGGGGGKAGSASGGAGGSGGSTPTAGANVGSSTGGAAAGAGSGGAAGTNAGGGATGATSAGGLAQGGDAGWKPATAGGSGGGGYYGGGGGGADETAGGSGGGGGSSWAGGTGVTAASFTDGANSGDGSITVSVASAITTSTFAYNGGTQTYTVPAGVTAVSVNIAGGMGGASGDGDIVYGQLPVTAGQVLHVTIGGRGIGAYIPVGGGAWSGGQGGYNGGGSVLSPYDGRVGGGGASDIRVAPYGLADRVVVAGGGGGTGFGVGSGWFGAKGGALADGTGGAGARAPGETVAGGGTLTAGGQATPALVGLPIPNTTIGAFGEGGDALLCSGAYCGNGTDWGGGGGGYYGGSAGPAGGGGSSYASITGPDATMQGVGNVLGTAAAAAFQHLQGGSAGDGYAVITSMPVTVTGASTESVATPGTWTIQGTINPKSLASTPFAFWGSDSAVVAAGGGTSVAITGPGGAVNLAGDSVQAVSGTITGVAVGSTSYYRICARSVAGYSCGAVQSFGYKGESGGGGGSGSNSGGGDASDSATASASATPSASAKPSATGGTELDPLANPNSTVFAPGNRAPGTSTLLVNGVPTPLTIRPNERANPTGLDFQGDGWKMRLVGRGDDSDPLGLTDKNALILQSDPLPPRSGQRAAVSPRMGVLKPAKVKPVAQASGDGFQASTPVKFYLLPSTYLGQLMNDASGTFKGNIPIPPGIAPGQYTLQMNGFAPSGAIRSLSIGVIVKSTAAATAKKSATVYFAPMSPVITKEGKALLRALARGVGGKAVRTVSIGYVQPTPQTGNDQSLSTQRAKNVAAFLRSLGVRGAYVVRGDGVAEQTGAKARRVNATVTYVR